MKYYAAWCYRSHATSEEDIDKSHPFETLDEALLWGRELWLPGEEALGVYAEENGKFALVWGT